MGAPARKQHCHWKSLCLPKMRLQSVQAPCAVDGQELRNQVMFKPVLQAVEHTHYRTGVLH